MSCNVCKPILTGDTWRVEMEAGHVDQSKVVLSEVMGGFGLIIYPKPYKPQKFWKTLINNCPYCGEDLKAEYRKNPELLEGELNA